MRSDQEKPVKIQRLLIYPCRGVQGIDVDHVKVSRLGIKYDREWAVYNREKMAPVYLSPEVKLTKLRQRIERDPVSRQKHLVFSVVDEAEAAKLPSRELRVPIRKQVEGEVVETKKGHGISEGPEADRWFSAFLGYDAFLLRSAPNWRKKVPSQALPQTAEGDETKGFVSKAAVHIVNEASVRDLRERVLSKIEDPAARALTKIEATPFRPNFVIDSGVAFSEDTYQEARVGNVLFRLVGYCSRCKAVTCNFDTNERNPELEPTPTLTAYRKHELGVLFGTYNQVEVISSPQQFRRLLGPSYFVPLNRKYDPRWGVICRGDELRVRIAE